MKSLLFVSFVQVLGYLLLLIGLALRYWLNRRKFNRIVGYRTEGFRSYEHKTAARGLEWLLKKSSLGVYPFWWLPGGDRIL